MGRKILDRTKCTSCGVVKTKENTYSDANKPDGLKTQCTACKTAAKSRGRDIVSVPVMEGNVIQFPPVARAQFSDQQIETVDARTLWDFLGVQSRFADWIKNRIEECQFQEGRDYVAVSKPIENALGGRSLEYHITLDMAKHLAMMERTDRGYQAREYFIECEKKLRSTDQDLQRIMVNTIVEVKELSRSIMAQVGAGFLEVKETQNDHGCILEDHGQRLERLEKQKRRNPRSQDQQLIIDTVRNRFHRYCPMCGRVLILDENGKPNKHFNWEHKENCAWNALAYMWATCSDCNQKKIRGELDPHKLQIRFENFHIELNDYKDSFPKQLTMTLNKVSVRQSMN